MPYIPRSPVRITILRPDRHEDERQLLAAREMINRARKLLEEASPSTFLGGRHLIPPEGRNHLIPPEGRNEE
jgi:hypothetical protein